MFGSSVTALMDTKTSPARMAAAERLRYFDHRRVS